LRGAVGRRKAGVRVVEAAIMISLTLHLRGGAQAQALVPLWLGGLCLVEHAVPAAAA